MIVLDMNPPVGYKDIPKSKYFSPSLWEITQAFNIFKERLESETLRTPNSNKEAILNIALSAVWRAGREYQVELEHREQMNT